MKTKWKPVVAVLFAGVNCLTAQNAAPEGAPGSTESGGGSRQGRGLRPVPPLIAALDANRDGRISAEEIANAAAALKTLDENGDGSLTLEELRPPRPPRRGEGRDAAADDQQQQPMGPPPGKLPPVIAALDADQDGEISAAEIEKSPEALRGLDRDGDGNLGRRELRPQGGPPPEADEEGEQGGRGGMRQHGRGPRGGRGPGMHGGPPPH